MARTRLKNAKHKQHLGDIMNILNIKASFILGLLAISLIITNVEGFETYSTEKITDQDQITGHIVDIKEEIWYDPDGADHSRIFYLDNASVWITTDEKAYRSTYNWSVGDRVLIVRYPSPIWGYSWYGYHRNTDTEVGLMPWY